MDQKTHEDRLRREMTVAQGVWREAEPVAVIGGNQNPSDFRDQQMTAAWAEGNFLVSGRTDDPVAVRVAAELATEGRGMSGKDARDLAEAITVVNSTMGTPAREDQTFTANVARAIAAAGEGVMPALDGSVFDYVVGKGGLNDLGTAARLEEIASTRDTVSLAVADAPLHGLGSGRDRQGNLHWQIIDGGTGEIVGGNHANAAAALGSLRAITGLGITYEGVDMSDREADWQRSLHMPGDKVRFDSEAKVAGIDPHDTMDALGVDALTISKAVVRGEMVPNHMGGERKAAFLEYEFEGKDGRHNAKQFMEEGGREHMYGVVLVRDDRMWAVPIHLGADGTAPVVDGAAREIVGFAGRDQDQLDPDGVDGMRNMVREENGIAGEFYVQPRDGYGAPGPVNLLNSPWSSGVSVDEREIAEKAIDRAVAQETREREDPVGVLVDSMRHSSIAWRTERPVSDEPLKHDAAMEAARSEARYLMRGRDVRDPNVRMAAAMVATDGRPVDTLAGDLSATSLADQMSPAPEGTRKGILAQASGLLSRAPVDADKPLSKGVEADGDGPSISAAAMSRGGQGR